MGLIYFFSLFEGFNKDYFQALFTFKPEIMKSKKKIDYEFLLDFNNNKDLSNALAQKEVDALGRSSIDDLVNFSIFIPMSSKLII